MSPTITSPARATQERGSTVDPACMSHYLELRHLPDERLAWKSGVRPTLPAASLPRTTVASSDDLLDALADHTPRGTEVGLLLSGGIDSAILAALVRPGTPCFTIAFDAPGAVDESAAAAAFAARWGHPHHTLRVSWPDYLAHADCLMRRKQAPLHAIEVPLYLAAQRARAQGVSSLVVGNGADSTFGGMDKLLARDWTFDGFVRRYRFADASTILRRPITTMPVFEPYRRGDGFDVHGFLHRVHGQGIVQAFENAIGAARVTVCAPYEMLELAGALDIDRIRRGEPKYLLREIFRTLYEADEVPTKVPFARPTDIWFQDWEGPASRAEFRPDVGEALQGATGEAKWLTWCLDAFCRLLDRHPDG